MDPSRAVSKFTAEKLPMTMPMNRSNASTRKQQVLNTGIRGMRCSGDLYLGRDWKNPNQSEGQEIGLNTNNDVAIHLLILSDIAKTPGKWMRSSNNHPIGSLSRVDMDSCSTSVTSFPLYDNKFRTLPFPKC